MTSALATYTILGIPMQRRSTRRKLVITTYLVLGLICFFTSWFESTTASSVSWALYSALAVSIFLFGGQGRYGLIKPFLNRPPHPEPLVADLVRLHLDPLSVGAPETSAWKNDERELARRDRAHYSAYQPLSVALVILLMLSAYALHPPAWIPLTAILSVIFTVALVACVIAVTLPSAMILWSEDDLEPVEVG